MSAEAPLTFLEAFRQKAGPSGILPFAEFMQLALYHPALGYYRQNRTRVGRGPGTDFYTASNSAPLFGELVAAASASLVRAHGGDPAHHVFVEIGAETPAGVLANMAHPFAAARVVHLGEPLALAGNLVVFSNELFDAQPCRRFVRRGPAWHELGVSCQTGNFCEVEMGNVAADWLPEQAPDGYLFDAPRAAIALLEALINQPWQGLFLAFDYGKSWAALAEETPGGTARAYHRHRQHNDLLARPGEQDLTCHVCWDWLHRQLEQHGFIQPQLDAQEAFFIRQAEDLIARTMAQEASRMSSRKMALMQLLHPGNLGRKFQALHGWRS